MGLFDSFYIKCPKCKNELEFQSKSGECALSNYTSKNLTPEVAIGMNGDIVKCEFCNINFKIVCDIPKIVKVKLIKTKMKENYRGNYNKDLPKNKEQIKRIKDMFKE